MSLLGMSLALENSQAVEATLHILHATFNLKLPLSISVDEVAIKRDDDWLKHACRAQKSISAYWNKNETLDFTRRQMLYFELDTDRLAVPFTLELLENIPFEVASISSLHPEWQERDHYGFSDGHWPLGWGCAFKGVGHERLVSRRWLEHGPWQLYKGANDTSLVLFHDPAQPEAEAWKLANKGHRRMGISDEGGFIQTDFVYEHELDGLYDSEGRCLKIIVHGRQVGQGEMLEARAALRDQALGDEMPLERVAYIFMKESEARAHLHELWLRGLECWAIIAGEEVRLDSDYQP